MPPFRSSGDLVADRRFAYAAGYRAAGEHAAAAELLEQTVALVPGWSFGWLALGEAWEGAGQPDAAARAYAEALRLDEGDGVGAGPRLARLRGETPAALPARHVQALFDDYAGRFDRALAALGYRGPELLAAALRRVAPARRFRRALDLGCGTGLMAPHLRPLADRLEGVDLSPAMVAKAAERELYDALVVADLVPWVAGAGRADLAVAADVLVYLGDLGPCFAAVAAALLPGGLFLFTVERHDGDGHRLQPSLRFAHGEASLRALALAHGFVPVAVEAAATRRDAGADVPGLVVALGRA